MLLRVLCWCSNLTRPFGIYLHAKILSPIPTLQKILYSTPHHSRRSEREGIIDSDKIVVSFRIFASLISTWTDIFSRSLISFVPFLRFLLVAVLLVCSYRIFPQHDAQKLAPKIEGLHPEWIYCHKYISASFSSNKKKGWKWNRVKCDPTSTRHRIFTLFFCSGIDSHSEIYLLIILAKLYTRFNNYYDAKLTRLICLGTYLPFRLAT